MSRPVRPTVLHVVEGPTAVSSEFDRAIAQAGFDVEHVETVYGAMARLVRPTHGPIRAVVVCVDGLDAPDLEFFTLVARRRPNVPVYVHGQCVDAHRRQRAVALGAQSEVRPDHIATVLTELAREEPAEAQEPPVEAPTGPPPPAASERMTVVEGRPAPSTPDTVGPDDRIRDGDAPELGEARLDPPVPQAEPKDARLSHAAKIPTPWEPAADAPRRIPPRANTPAARDEADDRASNRAEELGPPLPQSLLSPQEIDALLSEPHPSEQAGDAADHETG